MSGNGTLPISHHPGLYVHIPFCCSRCGYCTFTSGLYNAELADNYIDALHIELEAREIFSPSTPPSTLFLGGGTPSILSVRQLDRLLDRLPRAELEATCEVNPDSITPDKLRVLKEHGINRLSIGVQTFSPEGLLLLGRAHKAEAALEAVAMAQKIGFSNINVDLICCWPGQDTGILEKDIELALNLKIQHISYYTMILEPECPSYLMLSDLMSRYKDTDKREKSYWDIIEYSLDSKKFIHYETSNYALSDNECKHNTNTWRGGEYLGVGIAAHSYISGRRSANTNEIDLYLKNSRYPSSIEVMSESLAGKDKARECAVFWLRLFEGIEINRFEEQTGYTLDGIYGTTLSGLLDRGLLEYDKSMQYIRVPKKIQPVLDSVLVELI